MTTKKKVEAHSSTDSSTASSTDNSSSSSSSSGSGSDSSSSSDSDSSTSQEESNKTQQVVETKKPEAVQKPRKSVDGKQTSASKNKPKAKQQSQPQPPQQQKRNIYSTDDEEEKNDKAKRKNITKPKTVATVAPKQAPAKGKIANKPSVKTTTVKDAIKSKTAVKNIARNDNNKKKSIFSPENSSESDNATNVKLTAIKGQAKNNQKPRTKASPRALNKAENKKIEKPVVKPKPKPEVKAKSSASSNSSSSESSSDSDSDSSNSSDNKKKAKSKAAVVKKDSNSETEADSNEKVTKKLTRSSNARKSKHILGKNLFSDTDSDDSESTKRALSRSPVKKTPVSSTPATTTKGKQKSKKNEVKVRSNEVLEERKCPVEGCDSNGHMSGRHDKHFTVDGCLLYHNMTIAQSKEQMLERKKRDELRKKGMETYRKSMKGHQTSDQKQYLQKIKDLRLKFKQEAHEDQKPSVDKNREPNLFNFVPEYDLKLFRDAQAISSEKIEEDLKTLPNTKGTKYIEMGKFEMEVWYQSPYPEDYARLPKLYICEFCLRYMKSRTVLLRHVVKCVWRHPPGEEVYRKDKISVWEVDGKRYKQYCQNLCLLAKFFLDHKTLYYDVEPFLFYVMTMADLEGCHTVGYFSKEKNSFLNYNVSCILTLPPYQRQGYGRLLIDFSYLLTRVEGKIGSPEKPLSDLGLISYRSYWKDVLLGYLCSRAGTALSVKDISQEMAIHSYDIVSTLQALGMMKYWKGKHIILKKQDVLDEYVERVKRRGSLLKEVDPSCLKWKPFVPPQPNPV